LNKKIIALSTAVVIGGSTFFGVMNTSWAQKIPQQIEQSFLKPAVRAAEEAAKEETFRNVTVADRNVQYIVSGKARVHEGTYNYTVKQGGMIVAEGFGTASMGAPEWGTFKQKVSIPASKMSDDQPLTMELFQIDMESGKAVNKTKFELKKQSAVNMGKSAKTFRSINVSDPIVQYTVSGEARVHEGTYNYAVKQGDVVVADGFGTASMGAPEWGTFAQEVSIPASKLSNDQPLTMELYEIDMESGEAGNKSEIELEAAKHKTFRDINVSERMVKYMVEGKARVNEGTYNYAVKQGDVIVAEGFGTATMGAPEWGTFAQEVSIPASKLSGDQPLTFELYEIDMESGEAVNKVSYELK